MSLIVWNSVSTWVFLVVEKKESKNIEKKKVQTFGGCFLSISRRVFDYAFVAKMWRAFCTIYSEPSRFIGRVRIEKEKRERAGEGGSWKYCETWWDEHVIDKTSVRHVPCEAHQCKQLATRRVLCAAFQRLEAQSVQVAWIESTTASSILLLGVVRRLFQSTVHLSSRPTLW